MYFPDMAPIVCDKKFSEHGSEVMKGFGYRQAKGGMRGNTFEAYTNEESLHKTPL